MSIRRHVRNIYSGNQSVRNVSPYCRHTSWGARNWSRSRSIHQNPSYDSPAETALATADLIGEYGPDAARVTGIPYFAIAHAERMACGYNGCDLRLIGYPDWKSAIKFTKDLNEVAAAAHIRSVGGHPDIITHHAAFIFEAAAVGAKEDVGFIWRERVEPINSPEEAGIYPEVFQQAVEMLQDHAEVMLFGERGGPTKKAYLQATKGSGLEPLWDLQVWLTQEGIYFRPHDWKKENLGVRPDGQIVLIDLGAHWVHPKLMKATPRH